MPGRSRSTLIAPHRLLIVGSCDAQSCMVRGQAGSICVGSPMAFLGTTKCWYATGRPQRCAASSIVRQPRPSSALSLIAAACLERTGDCCPHRSVTLPAGRSADECASHTCKYAECMAAACLVTLRTVCAVGDNPLLVTPKRLTNWPCQMGRAVKLTFEFDISPVIPHVLQALSGGRAARGRLEWLGCQ